MLLCKCGAMGVLLALMIACGGGNSASPSGGSGSGSGGSGTSNFGTVTATIDGVAYTGVIITASSSDGTLRIASNSADLTRSINFSVRPATVGTTTVFLGSALSMNVITTTGSTVIGSWAAGGGSGSGTITVASLTSTGASGTFSFSAPPAPSGSGGQATGTKVVTNGSFTARF